MWSCLYELVVLENMYFISFYNCKTPQKIRGIALEYSLTKTYTTNHIIITVQRIHYKQKGKKEDIKTNAFVVCLVFHLNIFLVFKLPKPKVPKP